MKKFWIPILILPALVWFIGATMQSSPGVSPEGQGPQTSAFGEASVAEPTPVVQIHFPYNVNEEIVHAFTNTSGTVAIDSNRVSVSTGASANSSAQLNSREPLAYRPGQGALFRGTALFTACIADSVQWFGIGDNSDGYFFGCNGATFGIMRRQGGSSEVRTLTVTTGSSTAEDITITLDGDAEADVAVTNTASVTLTANEIASHDFSDLGAGWRSEAVGDTVVFISYDAADNSGTCTLSSATSAVGSCAQTVAGVAPTETFIAQTAWSHDVMDGSGPSGMDLVETNGNVYQIKYQWLGFGRIESSIENENTGKHVLVNRIDYTNANTVPSVDNPTLPLYIHAENTANTSDLSIKSASMAGFVEGRVVFTGPKHATNTTAATFTAGTERPVLTIRNNDVYQSVINRVVTNIENCGLSQDTTKTSTVNITLNATLTGASFSDVSANTSTVQVDTSATAMTGGDVMFSTGIARTDSTDFKMGEHFHLEPGETMTVSLNANANNPDVTAFCDWTDDF